MEETGLTSSLFADEIGVARAGISHILSGRNKPSLPILVKIIRRFPEYGNEWILDDEPETELVEENQPEKKSLENQMGKPAGQEKQFYNPVDQVFNPLSGIAQHPEKKIERIVIFFSDRSFLDYKPGS